MDNTVNHPHPLTPVVQDTILPAVQATEKQSPDPVQQPPVKLQRDSKGRFIEGRWKKGQSGNPAGRLPKPFIITSLVKDLLGVTDEKTGKTNAMLIAEAMVKQALHSPEVLKQVLERVEGKVTESIDMRAVGINILYELVKPKGEEKKLAPFSETGKAITEGEKE